MPVEVYTAHFMHDVLYLHGFGETNPECCPIVHALRIALPGSQVLSPCYHPGGRIAATRVVEAIKNFTRIINLSTSGKVHVVGYSFGGLLAGILAESQPDIIANMLLLAPAIDNFSRNYEGHDPPRWQMPRDYVEELKSYPARPRIVRPTTLVHGWLDDDNGGSAPWRIQEWAAEQSFRNVFMLSGVGHSLEPWLSAASWKNDGSDNIPTFHQIVTELVST